MFELIKKIFTPLPPPTSEELEEVRKKWKLQLDMRRGMIPMDAYEKELRKKIAEMASQIHVRKAKGFRADLKLEVVLEVIEEELKNIASREPGQSSAPSNSQANFGGYDDPKIFGPLTLHQFVYLFGGAGVVFLLYTQLSPQLTFMLGFPVAVISFYLAFFRKV